MKKLNYLPVLTVLLLIAPAAGYAQTKMTRADSIKSAADNKRLIFIAQSTDIRSGAGSESGLTKDVTQDKMNHIALPDSFRVVIKKDTVGSYLPYFGVVSDTFNDNDTYNNLGDIKRLVTVGLSGTHYITTNYKYAVKQKKKGDVDIKINPIGEPQRIDQYDIAITPTGRAELTLSIHGHDDIIYEGYVKY